MESGPIADVQVFYDSDCAFCTRVARVLRRLDRRHRLRLVPLREASALADAPSQARLSAALHCRDRSGRWFAGGDACLRIAAEIPGLRLLARLGRLPVAHGMVDLGYRLIAANRKRLSRLVVSHS
ncbi:MAG: DCC1-like thiol-disulfide oxidoreductase family protein [Chloroflexota bacterium]